jgi:hypothetical protein
MAAQGRRPFSSRCGGMPSSGPRASPTPAASATTTTTTSSPASEQNGFLGGNASTPAGRFVCCSLSFSSLIKFHYLSNFCLQFFKPLPKRCSKPSLHFISSSSNRTPCLGFGQETKVQQPSDIIDCDTWRQQKTPRFGDGTIRPKCCWCCSSEDCRRISGNKLGFGR